LLETLAAIIICLAFLFFLGDNTKTWKVFVLYIIIGLMAATVVSAEEEHTINSGSEVTSASTGKDYIVNPWTENSSDRDSSISSLRSTQYISQGQTINHYVGVGSRVNWLEVDLNWGDTSDSLALTVYSPSGTNLGTYHDNSDGSVNGRIHLNIYPSQEYIQQGTWRFKVYGESVSGTEDYTFNLYQH
jgi:hypothetical protein